MSHDFEADVVIVGAGLAGALTAARLSEVGLSVLMLEAGPSRKRGDALQVFEQAANSLKTLPEIPYPEAEYAPKPATLDPNHYFIQNGPEPFQSGYERQVGGTTWHWLGTTLRLLPSDFRLQSKFGVGADWPIGYDDLEPWYGQAEKELGVSGDSSNDLGSPRTSPYPNPPIPISYLDQTVLAAAKGLGLQVSTTPAARNSQAYDDRPACCGNHNCIPLCPIAAKYDASVHVSKAQQAGARVLDQAVAYKIELDDTGRVSAVHFMHPDGSTQTASGKVFVIAGHAIETPKLLLMSRTGSMPNGVANSSDQVGRNLMDHPTLLSWALTKEPVYPYRGPLSTAGIETMRDGDFRSQHGSFRIEIGNDGWSWPVGDMTQIGSALASKGTLGKKLVSDLNDEASRHIRMAALVEQLPDPNNRVTVSDSQKDALGIPRPAISYSVSDYTRQGLLAAKTTLQKIYDALEATQVQFSDGYFGAGHIMGTYRMGKDPKTSVVDAELRSHDHDNLFLMGSGVYPSVGCSNPSLTIAALSLRAAATIQADLAS